MLIFVNLKFSEFFLIWQSGHLKNGVLTQVGHLLFSRQFKQAIIEDLAFCPEFKKSQTTDYLDSIALASGTFLVQMKDPSLPYSALIQPRMVLLYFI